MPSFIPTLQSGSTTTQAVTAADLGNVLFIGANRYRVVKAASSIASPAGKVLVTALSSGVPTWSVDTSTSANDKTVAGVVPAEYTATIAAASYFLLQVAGPTLVLSAGSFSAGDFIGTSTTAGKAGAVTMTVTVTGALDADPTATLTGTGSVPGGAGAIGIALAAATGADQQRGVMLRDLG